jgi:TfoX/Sxy family transcriptional regulator of competence genes
MTSWDALADAAVGGAVTRGTMFGSQGLRTGTKFFAIWWHERLVLKLPADRREALVSGGAAQPFEPMEGRPMNGWVVVDDAVDRAPLVEEARAFVESQQR